jgi:hypothetical protein
MPRGPRKVVTEHLAIRLEPELLEVLKEMAGQEERTSSQMARILLREAIEARQAKKGRKKPS